MFRKNDDIRKAKGNIPFWVIADQLGVHENTMYNWMKKEMSSDKKQQILKAIEQVKKESEVIQ